MGGLGNIGKTEKPNFTGKPQILAARRTESGTNIAGVERARDGGIFCAFENGAAIGKHGHLIWINAESEQEFVVPDIGDGGCKPCLQRFQIESSTTLVNLDGVTPAEGDVRLRLSLEIRELTASAGAAGWILGHADGLKMAGPNIAGDQAAVERLFTTSQELEGFGDFERGDEVDDGAEDADGVAGFLEAMAVGGGFEEAGETRSETGEDGHCYAVTGDGGGVNPGNGGLDGEVVDEEAGFEVVGAIEDKIKASEQLPGVARV